MCVQCACRAMTEARVQTHQKARSQRARGPAAPGAWPHGRCGAGQPPAALQSPVARTERLLAERAYRREPGGLRGTLTGMGHGEGGPWFSTMASTARRMVVMRV